ncbi:MAG: Clp protease N-terminal domain-containing protein [Candidatus Acidiferrales bacterium]
MIFFARIEASQFGGRSIDTEHLLLGLIKQDSSLARTVLPRPDAVEFIRMDIEAQIPRAERYSTSIEIPLSKESKNVLRYAEQSADMLHQRQIDSVHLLLGLLGEKKCVAARILGQYGVTTDAIEQKIRRLTETHATEIWSAPEIVLDNSLAIDLQMTADRFLDAWRAREADAVANLFEPEGQFCDERGEWHRGSRVRDGIAHYFGATEDALPAMKGISLPAQNIAILTIVWASKGTSEGQTAQNFYLIVAMRESAGGWRAATAHLSRL